VLASLQQGARSSATLRAAAHERAVYATAICGQPHLRGVRFSARLKTDPGRSRRSHSPLVGSFLRIAGA